MGKRARAKGIYDRALTKDELAWLPAARELKGLDEEIAVLRVRLSSLLAENDRDYKLLEKGMTALARTLAVRHRISPRSGKDLGERLAAALQAIGDQILPPD